MQNKKGVKHEQPGSARVQPRDISWITNDSHVIGKLVFEQQQRLHFNWCLSTEVYRLRSVSNFVK
jgi:hypothetical protein